MRVLLIDVDSKIPNLALMKLSAWHKRQGDEVSRDFYAGVDRVYVSCVFTKHRAKAEAFQRLWPNAVIGGSGWDLSGSLPDEVEAMRPDYALYGIDHGIGYTSRGCIRRCGFCVVPEKEGGIRSVATIREIVNPKSKFVVLLDNNFLANPDWASRALEIEDNNLQVNFSQGLDIRLVDEVVASWLARIRFTNLHCTRKQVNFAFDHVGIERQVREGIQRLFLAGLKPYQIGFYVLAGYDSTFEEDMVRFEILRGLGVEPFVMLYHKRDRRLNAFARWVNRRLYKSCAWEDYRRWNKAKLQAEMFEEREVTV